MRYISKKSNCLVEKISGYNFSYSGNIDDLPVNLTLKLDSLLFYNNKNKENNKKQVKEFLKAVIEEICEQEPLKDSNQNI